MKPQLRKTIKTIRRGGLKMGLLLPFFMLSFFLDMIMTPGYLVYEAGKAVVDFFASMSAETVQASSFAQSIGDIFSLIA